MRIQCIELEVYQCLGHNSTWIRLISLMKQYQIVHKVGTLPFHARQVLHQFVQCPKHGSKDYIRFPSIVDWI
jgi:hypothetical protein